MLIYELKTIDKYYITHIEKVIDNFLISLSIFNKNVIFVIGTANPIGLYRKSFEQGKKLFRSVRGIPGVQN